MTVSSTAGLPVSTRLTREGVPDHQRVPYHNVQLSEFPLCRGTRAAVLQVRAADSDPKAAPRRRLPPALADWATSHTSDPRPAATPGHTCVRSAFGRSSFCAFTGRSASGPRTSLRSSWFRQIPPLRKLRLGAVVVFFALGAASRGAPQVGTPATHASPPDVLGLCLIRAVSQDKLNSALILASASFCASSGVISEVTTFTFSACPKDRAQPFPCAQHLDVLHTVVVIGMVADFRLEGH